MEKFKFIIITILLVVLALTIFLKNQKKDQTIESQLKNYAIVNITFEGKTEDKQLKFLPGRYFFSLSRFEIVQDPYFGWHLSFLDTVSESIYRIFSFDLVETSNLLKTANFPVTFSKKVDTLLPVTPKWFFSGENLNHLYLDFFRGYFQYGYIRKHNNIFDEETLMLVNFYVFIDTLWVEKHRAGIKMAFVATPMQLISSLYGGNYLIYGLINIEEAFISPRYIQY